MIRNPKTGWLAPALAVLEICTTSHAQPQEPCPYSPPEDPVCSQLAPPQCDECPDPDFPVLICGCICPPGHGQWPRCARPSVTCRDFCTDGPIPFTVPIAMDCGSCIDCPGPGCWLDTCVDRICQDGGSEPGVVIVFEAIDTTSTCGDDVSWMICSAGTDPDVLRNLEILSPFDSFPEFCVRSTVPGQVTAVAVPDSCDLFPLYSEARIQIPSPCAGDLDMNGVVEAADLSALILAWGPCPADDCCCSGDLNGDGEVTAADLSLLIINWGPC